MSWAKGLACAVGLATLLSAGCVVTGNFLLVGKPCLT